MSFHYRRYDGGPDPLAPPFDASAVVDAFGQRLMAGESARQALRGLWEEGLGDKPGLAYWRREIARRRRELRNSGQLDGILRDIADLLDRALTAERTHLFADPSDDARFREAMLDMLPDSPAPAVQQLRDYDWQSDEARQLFDQLRERLRRDMIDQQFQDLTQGIANLQDPNVQEGLREMLDDLNRLLQHDSADPNAQKAYEEFLAKHGEFFPDAPATFDEFIDELARRAAAAQRLLNSLSPEQRAQLQQLTAAAFDDPRLADLMAQTQQQLRQLRPNLPWSGSEQFSGEGGLGLPDATSALAELADLDALAEQFGRGGSWSDPLNIDEAAVARALGRSAADNVSQLQSLLDQLQSEGFLTDHLELTPKAVRRIGTRALARVFDNMTKNSRGDHESRRNGQAGEFTGHTRAWQFGDEQPIDVTQTIRNALRRPRETSQAVQLTAEDFEVRETDDRVRTAVTLLVDQSFSMWVNDTWQPAKTTALALASLITGSYPTDALEIIAFANIARPVKITDVPDLAAAEIQGTNLHHALLLAGRFFDRQRAANRVCMVITDGEPTAHLTDSGEWDFCWPPSPATLTHTVAQVDAMTRRRVPISWFRLGDEPRLARFVDAMAARNRGRVFAPSSSQLGSFVVSDYVRARRV